MVDICDYEIHISVIDDSADVGKFLLRICIWSQNERIMYRLFWLFFERNAMSSEIDGNHLIR